MTLPENGISRRRAVAIAAAATIAVIIGVAGIAVARGGGSGHAFVAAEPDTGYVMTLKGSEQNFTLSALAVRRPGAEIHVLKVEALTSPNVEYIGGVTVWPRDSAANALSIGPGFPAPEIKLHHPLDEVIPASETDLPAPTGVSSQPPTFLALGFRLTSGDLGAVNGVRVMYTANGQKVEQTFRYAAIVCSQAAACKPAQGESDTAFNHRVLDLCRHRDYAEETAPPVPDPLARRSSAS